MANGDGEGLPLEGIRILDFTQGVAGPYATKLYGDFGADVIKIERPDGGDPMRRAGPFPNDEPHPERGGVFLHLNTGKRSVSLNLRTASGQRIAQRLAAESDLVFESFRPGALARLGLDAERLAKLNPRASLIQISNYGQYGPYRDFEADDMLAYATSGVLQITGVPSASRSRSASTRRCSSRGWSPPRCRSARSWWPIATERAKQSTSRSRTCSAPRWTAAHRTSSPTSTLAH